MVQKLIDVPQWALTSQVRLVAYKKLGPNSAQYAYEEYADGVLVSTGVADCYDVRSITVDHKDDGSVWLAEKTILSQAGDFIVQSRTANREGLGRKPAELKG